MTYIKTTLKREIAIDSIITIHYFEYMKDFVFHGESHDFWEFLYVDQGSVIVQAGENHFRMEAGDIIKPNAPFGSQQMILLYLELFLITLEQNYLQLDAKPPERKRHFPLATPIELSDTKAQRIEEIIQYMQFCICEQLNTNQICQHFSMSRSSLQKLFQKEKGCGPMEYFNRIKIQRAKAMIRDGSKNFTEIAGFLSYSSPQYFSRQFKKSTGMSPMEYASSVKGISQALKGDD